LYKQKKTFSVAAMQFDSTISETAKDTAILTIECK